VESSAAQKLGLEIRMIILGWTMREANINTDSVVDNLLRVYPIKGLSCDKLGPSLRGEQMLSRYYALARKSAAETITRAISACCRLISLCFSSSTMDVGPVFHLCCLWI
jgi:hypothetical protein